jgi:rSAM/selenodomain-associated transferase 1
MDAATSITFGVMARAPIPGRCKTRLARSLGDAAAALLQRAMLLDTLDLLARRVRFEVSTRYVVLAAPEHDGVAALRELVPPAWEVMAQRGADLGARLANGMDDLALGGALACLVDSDSPTLPPAALEPIGTVEDQGQHGDVVIGPSEDGGYYLIGTSRPDPRLFEGIPWSTSGVMEATRRACRALGRRIHELPYGYDVDDADDLHRMARELEAHPDRAPMTARALSEVRAHLGSPA